MTAVLVEGLGHSYGNGHVLDDVTFTVPRGELVALLGPSGAGKTTLFRCLTGLAGTGPARTAGRSEGHVEIEGRRIDHLQGRALRQSRRDVAVIYQQFQLVRRLSALDNVLAGRLSTTPTWRVALRRFRPADVDVAWDALEQVDLAHLAHHRADRLSGGQQQRVAIARALAQESRVVLADEPVASLDPATSDQVLGILRRVARRHGMTVLCSLHQVELARGFADRIIGMREGRLVFDAPAAHFDREAHQQIYTGVG